MTNEEVERSIEFLLKHQADFEARQATFETRLLETSQQVGTMASAHTEFTQFVRGFMEAQGELNNSLKETVRALTIRQAQTDERLDAIESKE